MSRTDIYPPQSYNVPEEFSGKSRFYDPTTNTWSAWYGSSYMNQGLHGAESRQSLSTYRYAQAQDTGNLPENAFSYSLTRSHAFRGRLHRITSDYYAVESLDEGQFSSGFLPPPTLAVISAVRRTNLDNEVRQKVLARVRDSDVNLGVIWGEREQTLRLLTGSVKNLGKAYNMAKSGNYAGAAAVFAGGASGQRPPPSARAGVAQAWLELQYGWLPLMNDIFGLCETMQKQVRHREYVVIRSKKGIYENTPQVAQSGYYTDKTVFDAKYESSVRIKMRCTNMLLKTAAEVGLTNPLLVAWELVPFSFVVDWALPIGSFLSQFDSALGWEFFSGSQTRFYQSTASTERECKSTPPGFKQFSVAGSSMSFMVDVYRSPINSWAGMFSVPYIKDPTSMIHLLNALALLTSKR